MVYVGDAGMGRSFKIHQKREIMEDTHISSLHKALNDAIYGAYCKRSFLRIS